MKSNQPLPNRATRRLFFVWMALFAVAICPLSAAAFPSLSDSNLSTRIQNYWDEGAYINIQEGELGASPVRDTSAKWYFERVGSYYRIQNAVTGAYLHTENGAVEAGDILSGWWSAQWQVLNYGSYVMIRNRWRTNHYLHVQPGYLTSGTAASYWHSARWVLDGESTVPLSGSVSSFPSAANCSPYQSAPSSPPTSGVALSGSVWSFPSTSGSTPAPGTVTAPVYTRIQNCGAISAFLNVQDAELGVSAVRDTSAMWDFEPQGDYYFIRNRVTGDYLHTEYGFPEFGDVLTGWWSAQWVIETYPGYVRIRNRWRSGQYLYVSGGELAFGYASSSSTYSRWDVTNGYEY